jgi:hypothetical protein
LNGWEGDRNTEAGVEDEVALRGIDPRKQIALAVEVLVNVTVDHAPLYFHKYRFVTPCQHVTAGCVGIDPHTPYMHDRSSWP